MTVYTKTITNTTAQKKLLLILQYGHFVVELREVYYDVCVSAHKHTKGFDANCWHNCVLRFNEICSEGVV